jgi:aryl sulfotransferase
MTGVYWLASYPKSGNTWLRVLIHNLRNSEPANINQLQGSAGHGGGAQFFEDLSLVDPSLLSAAEIECLRPAVADAAVARRPDPPFFKTHDRWRLNDRGEPILGRAMAGAIYIVRDPRDVAVSLAYHSDQTLDRTIDILVGPEHPGPDDERGAGFHVPYRHGGWSMHLLSWLDQDIIPVHLVRYEDLRRDTVKVFGDAMAFAGQPIDRSKLEEAVERSDFRGLQKQETEHGFVERFSQRSLFFRSGQVGDWRTHLTGAQIARLEAGCALGMARLGYVPTVEPAAIADRSAVR